MLTINQVVWVIMLKHVIKLLSYFALVFVVNSLAFAGQASLQREHDFNFDWKFTLVETTEIPDSVPLNDAVWRDIRLPHDWSVEASFSEEWEGATGYLPGGVGIYQKHFDTPIDPAEQNAYVLFDGVYNNATFWVNGVKLGENPYGYSPVYFDLTDKLHTDGTQNVLTVHVDHSRYADSRWYTGSGIYRNVKLITTDKLHIPIWGTFVTTPEVNDNRAMVNLDVNVVNNHSSPEGFTLTTQLINPAGLTVAEASKNVTLESDTDVTVTQRLAVDDPKLWDTENPHIYLARTIIKSGERIVDSYVTPFGIRTLEFDAKKGFFLNGKPTLVKGVSLHHDGGLVGAAVPKEVWRRRLQSLKDAGLNAVRTAHNPFASDFLDLCDEMGILVQNEFFDEFDYYKDKRLNMHERHDDYITRGYVDHFQQWAKSDLTRTMLRDRNHPSVFQWSIGNEIEWTYVHYRYITGFWNDLEDPTNMDMSFWGAPPKYSPEELLARYEDSQKGEYVLSETARKLSEWVRALDTTRPVTANFIIPQVSHVSGYADAVDIVGYSYRNSVLPWGQKHFPEVPITINENPGTWDDWKQVLQSPGVFSQFMWTGIGYMGERHEKWPHKSGWGDMLDLAGFKRQGWNYFKSVWVNEPHLSIGTLPLSSSGFKRDELSGLAIAEDASSYRWRDTNMHWNYDENEWVVVEVTSNHHMVELLLNGESLGYRSMSEAPDRILRWVVPFAPGKLEAKAGFNGQETNAILTSANQPSFLHVHVDKPQLIADGYDIAHLVVQLVDDNGIAVQTEETEVSVSFNGPARLLGVDNGAPDNIQDFQSNKIVTSKGRALIVLQSMRDRGVIEVEVSAGQYGKQTLVIQSH